MPTPEWKQKRYKQVWYPGDTVNIGIGQGYWLATPLQLAHAVATTATRGVRVKPRLLHAVRRVKMSLLRYYLLNICLKWH